MIFLFFIKRKRVLLYPFRHSCRLPLVSKQFNKFFISCIFYPAEDITKVLYRIQLVISDICEDRHKPCKAHTCFRATYKETVVAVLRNPAYLTFADVVRQVKASVFKTTEHAWVFLQGIVNRLEKFRLFLFTEACLQLVKV